MRRAGFSGSLRSATSREAVRGAERSLIYSHRIRDCLDSSGRSIGVLCLVLRFDDEFESLFAKLLGPEDGTVLTLLDAESRERLAPPGQFSRLRAGGRKTRRRCSNTSAAEARALR